MQEKGFAPIFLIFAGLLLIAGYTIGSFTATHSITVTKINPDQTSQPTASPTPTARLENSFFSFFTKPTPTPTPQAQTTSQTEKSPQSPATTLPTATPALNSIITASGGYSYAGQNLTYSFTFPRNGGDVTGYVTGICTGSVNGKYYGGEGGNVSGQIPATCSVGFMKQSTLINYTGKVYLNEKRVDINWTGNIPFYSGSNSFSLYFQ
ncbi:MAG: hypothetical protein PHQ59_03745 [Candidatus Daviesbacteria bacterium]|nr:hypothetical protein [Candidatus Daviesbacteria bacterium]